MTAVAQQAEANGGFLRREELLDHHVDGVRIPVIDYSRGIRNPSQLSSTLSIVSSADGPYDDVESEDGLLHYAYRTGNPWAGDNRKLRRAMETGAPLILFRKEVANIYTPVMPVYVVDDVPEERSFTIALDESFTFMPTREMTADQRAYAVRLAKQRLHQPAFRTRVLVAYETRCAVCELRHGSLLDAAHIVPDSEEHGLPTVTNGLAMCKIHHAAYDQNMLGVSPDGRVRIAERLLTEVDGPMLRYGLQQMNGREVTVPRRRGDRPDRELLAWRYDRFTAAAGR
jgi:putative restriction endonuclease